MVLVDVYDLTTKESFAEQQFSQVPAMGEIIVINGQKRQVVGRANDVPAGPRPRINVRRQFGP